MGMLAGGNTVVFNPHPAAVKTSIYAINLLNEASLESGGPDNIAVTVEKPTLETSDIMMKHKDIPLIAATGGPGVVTAVLSSGKRGIGAGAGNPPALVDETADIRKAAEDIVNGCTFDNNLPCIAEKEIVAVDSIADELMYYMVSEQGCYKDHKGRAGCPDGCGFKRRQTEPQMCRKRCKDTAWYDRRYRTGQYQMYHI